MKLKPTKLSRLFRVEPFVAPDARGLFVKTYLQEDFGRFGLATQFEEEYYSISQAGVLRGLHFQVPPHAHDKVVCCVAGKVLDAIVDLRVGSPTFGWHETFELMGDRPEVLYIGAGMAHGFFVTEGPAILWYKVTRAYSAAADRGIRWDSAGIHWPTTAPVLSDRDRRFPGLKEYDSPFVFDPG